MMLFTVSVPFPIPPLRFVFKRADLLSALIAGAYQPDSRPASSEPPVGGTWVYWEHNRCTLSMADGTCS